MRFAKFFNVLNGLFYILYGLYGAFMPRSNAGNLGIELPSTLALHEWRAYNMFFVAFGALVVGGALRRTDQRLVLLAVIFVTLGFLAGRFLGLILDGAGPMLTYYEMGLEVVIITIGALLLKKIRPDTLT